MTTYTSKSSFSTEWIEQISSPIALINKNFELVYTSNNWLQEFGLEQNSVNNKNIFDLFPRFNKEWENRFQYCLDGLRDIKMIDRGEKEDPSAKTLIWDLNPWKDGYGHIIGVILKIETLTESKALELELKKTKLLLNQKSDIAKIGSWEYNLEMKSFSCTPNANVVYGMPKTAKPALQEVIELYKEGEDRETVVYNLEQAIEYGKPWNETLQLIKKDGSTIYVNSIGRPKFKEGKCIRVIGTVQDITETIKQQNNEPQNNKRLKEQAYSPYFEEVPYGLLEVDFTNCEIVNANTKLVQLLGIEKNNLLGKNIKTVLATFSPINIKPLIHTLKKNNTFFIEKIPLTIDNRTLDFKCQGKLILPDNKILVTVDVLEKNVASSVDKKELDKAKNQTEQLLNFAHMVSHNLKSHATNFSLLLTFLRKEKDDSEKNKLMDLLLRASDNLTGTIKSLREVVAIKNNINNKKSELFINDFIYKTEQNVIGLLNKNQGKIINEIADDITIKSIPAYLENILANCVTNAIMYRQENKNPIIIFSVEETESYTIINIEDNGTGIDLQKHGDKLFGLNKTFTNNPDSRGIGLYITKYQIEAMNGKIEVESTVGKGSIFKLFFNKKH